MFLLILTSSLLLLHRLLVNNHIRITFTTNIKIKETFGIYQGNSRRFCNIFQLSKRMLYLAVGIRGLYLCLGQNFA